MAENNIEEIVKKITSHPGVRGFVIVNAEGIPLRHSFHDNSRLLAVHYGAVMQQLAQRARRTVRAMDPTNDLSFLRVRSKKHEVLVAPHDNYVIVVIQCPET